MTTIEKLISTISQKEDFSNVNNIYKGKENLSRKNNLKYYLETMLIQNPKFLILGEAPGHKGCGITGIPFTSEVIINKHPFFKSGKFEVHNNLENLQTESTSTIVWNVLSELNSIPLLWNIFPFHPHKENNLQSNRKPIAIEIEYGKTIVDELLNIFNIKSENIISVGRTPESKYGNYLRHPSFGGKIDFENGIKEKLK